MRLVTRRPIVIIVLIDDLLHVLVWRARFMTVLAECVMGVGACFVLSGATGTVSYVLQDTVFIVWLLWTQFNRVALG